MTPPIQLGISVGITSSQVPDYKGNGGESGIRTHVTLSSKHAFQACAFSHSAISPAPSLGGRSEKLLATRLCHEVPSNSMGEGEEPQPAGASYCGFVERSWVEGTATCEALPDDVAPAAAAFATETAGAGSGGTLVLSTTWWFRQ